MKGSLAEKQKNKSQSMILSEIIGGDIFSFYARG